MSSADNCVRLKREDAIDLAVHALRACGAGEATAKSLASAAVDANAHGHHAQGLDHLDPYCDGLRNGRIDGLIEPEIEMVTPVLLHADARGGTAHLAFDRAFERFVDAAQEFGIAAYSCRNSYTCGELGWFVRRLLDRGLGGFAATNGGPALLAASGSSKAVFCTNPLAFGMPTTGTPLLIDQSSSSTAFTNIRHAAEEPGATIPLGWALDADGQPTTDPKKALDGVLLAYGGSRGANMALMVEILAGGLSGANWSVDAPAFHKGDRCPGIGQFVLAIDPEKFAGPDHRQRMNDYLERLETEFGVHLPGKRKYREKMNADREGVAVPERAIGKLQRYIEG